jgi:queuine tRNA-ribosyltransferase
MSNVNWFNVLCNSNEDCIKARVGILETAHSEIETPVFMPVGTLGSVKAIEHRELQELGARIILGNTYHLYLRPGVEILEQVIGLHNFMNWDKAILTDSGGFQIFSLSSLKKVNDEGVEFASHIDGSKHFFTPEKVIGIQRVIGSDIMMALDECLPIPSDRSVVEKSVRLTSSWEKRCYKHFKETSPFYGYDQRLFSICQGGLYKDLRKLSIEDILEDDFDGIAIGGLAVGEKIEEMYETVDYCTDILPENKPRYLMGVGTPIDLLESVERGVDMFDCVLPTRNARHGRLYTTNGEINLKNSVYKNNFNSPDEECSTYTSDNFSLAYLRHLFNSKEMLGAQLATIHNVGFYMNLMKNIRKSISENNFVEFKNEFIKKYSSDNFN